MRLTFGNSLETSKSLLMMKYPLEKIIKAALKSQKSINVNI